MEEKNRNPYETYEESEVANNSNQNKQNFINSNTTVKSCPPHHDLLIYTKDIFMKEDKLRRQ